LNARIKEALGIRSVTFSSYDGLNRMSHWKVTTEDGESFRVEAPNLAGEGTVLRYAAQRLAKMGRPVRWPDLIVRAG
jgi:hypothetical protein